MTICKCNFSREELRQELKTGKYLDYYDMEDRIKSRIKHFKDWKKQERFGTNDDFGLIEKTKNKTAIIILTELLKSIKSMRKINIKGE